MMHFDSSGKGEHFCVEALMPHERPFRRIDDASDFHFCGTEITPKGHPRSNFLVDSESPIDFP